MRVALVYRNFNLGGSLERDTVLLARALAGQGVEVHCYCNPDARTVELLQVTFHDVRPLTRSRSRLGYPLECSSFALAATRALRGDRMRYDIIDVRGISAWEHDVVRVHGVTRAHQERWPSEVGRGYRAARTRATLAPALRPQVALARAIERLQFRSGRYRRVMAATQQVREDLERTHAVPAELIDVIPPPIELGRLASESGDGLRESIGLGRDESLLLFVGHDFERKGLAEAIHALAGLDQPTHLVVVGAGDRKRFRHLAEDAGVAGRVHFVGRTEAPERFYPAADLFVLPTRNEPWGISVIEAMAAGIPVVTTEIAGAARVVEAAGAGLVLRDGSPRDLRDAISVLLHDPARRREMGNRGRAAAVPFGAEGHARAVLESYENALRHPRLSTERA